MTQTDMTPVNPSQEKIPDLSDYQEPSDIPTISPTSDESLTIELGPDKRIVLISSSNPRGEVTTQINITTVAEREYIREMNARLEKI